MIVGWGLEELPALAGERPFVVASPRWRGVLDAADRWEEVPSHRIEVPEGVDTIVAIDLVAADIAIPQMVELSLRNRPELAAAASRLEAADIRARQARYAPFLPKLQADYLTGGFGGGTNSNISNTEGRGDLLCVALRVGVPVFHARRAVDADDAVGTDTELA